MQIMVTVNFWAVLAAAVAAMVVGSIWYGPLFGKKFMEAKGMSSMSGEAQAQMKKGMMWNYVGQFVASLIMFYVLAWIIGALGMVGVMGGIQAAFWVWLGFIVTLEFGNAIWGGKMVLFWIGISNMLVTLILGGAIIGAW